MNQTSFPSRTTGGSFGIEASAALSQQMRDVGLVLLTCAEPGVFDVSDDATAQSDWLRQLLVRSPMFCKAATKAVETCNLVGECSAREVFPGCWVMPLHRSARRRSRRDTSFDVAVILTEAVLGAEQLALMCQSGQLDIELCQRLLRALPLAATHDVPRLATLIRLAHEDNMRHRANTDAMENVGQQLAESYEEINLLYSIIQSMTVEEQPQKFFEFVCKELLATMPYTWIGVIIGHDATKNSAEGRFEALAEELIVAGHLTQGFDAVRSASLDVLRRAQPGTPMVLEPAFNPEHAPFAALGHNALVQPIKQGDRVAGVLIAGEKRGPDRAVSSVDIKLVNATATYVAIFLENATLYDNLNAMFLGTLEALTASIDAKDRYTCGHSQRVAHMTRALAEALGHDEATLKRMHIAGLVHDVGKIGVPESVLLKPGRLTAEEFDWIRLHPEIGHRILKDIPQLNDVLPGVLHHHERWDGKGYPRGLAGEDIPLLARMIALADSFDAMSSNRTYREAMSRSSVLEEIRRNAGSQFDPDLVPAFLSLDFSVYDDLVMEHRAAEQRLRAVPGEAA